MIGPLSCLVFVHKHFLLREKNAARGYRLHAVAQYYSAEEFELVRVLLVLLLAHFVGIELNFAQFTNVLEIVEVLITLDPWVEDLQGIYMVTHGPQYSVLVLVYYSLCVFLSFFFDFFEEEILLRNFDWFNHRFTLFKLNLFIIDCFLRWNSHTISIFNC